MGGRNIWNYGKIRVNSKDVGAHRLAWELTYGAIPDKMIVCHKCDNPPCCRPSHLFLGTQSDNIKDSVAKGRQVGNTGNKKTKFSPEQIEEFKRSNLLQREIAKKYNVHQSTISRALNGSTKGGRSNGS